VNYFFQVHFKMKSPYNSSLCVCVCVCFHIRMHNTDWRPCYRVNHS